MQVDKPGAAIPKTLFGLFFEDINFGADGGLYPERVKNRSFEFPNPMMGWKQFDRGDSRRQLYIFDQGSIKDTPNSHYLRIKVATVATVLALLTKAFAASASRKMLNTRSQFERVASMEHQQHCVSKSKMTSARSGQTKISGLTNDWKTHTSTLRAAETRGKARLNVLSKEAARSTSTSCLFIRRTPGRTAKMDCAPIWSSC